MASTVGLCMIVKNEAHVIERCLASVRPMLDAWTIVDTGSTDGTQERIRNLMADIPGELHEAPWRNFGFNRSQRSSSPGTAQTTAWSSTPTPSSTPPTGGHGRS